jgi:hypothetical protein
MQRITSLLCESELDSIIKYVLVWNNSPKPVTYLVGDASLYRRDPTFTDAVARISCSEEKITDRQLRGEFVLLLAVFRLLAVEYRVLFCSSGTFPGCLGFAHRVLQGDAYLIIPEVIQTLHARVAEMQAAICCASTSPLRTPVQRPTGGVHE